MTGPRMGVEALVGAGERAKDRGKVARRLIGELGPAKGALVGGLGLVLVSGSTLAVAPWLVGRAIDGAIARGDRGALAGTMGLLLLVYLVGTLASRGQMRAIGVSGQRLLAGLRERLFARFQRLPLGWFAAHPVGDLVSRVVNDVDTLNQLFSMGLTQLAFAVVSLVGIVIAMLLLDWRMALVSFTIIPVMLLANRFFAGRARRAFRKTRETVGGVTAGLERELTTARESQAFARTQASVERFREQNAANRAANVQATGVTSAFAPTIDVLGTVAIAVVIGFGGWLAVRGEATVGLVAAFLIYVQQFFRPIQLASVFYTQAQSAMAGAERIYAVLDEPMEPPDAPGAQPLGAVRGKVEFDGVGFGYDAARPVLRGVSFTAEPGEMVALVGETGAGKTTVANLLLRFWETEQGVIRIDGHDIRTVTRESLRSSIALVLQDPFMMAGTVAENIAFGRPGATPEAVAAAARAVSAHGFIAELPKGYDTMIGEGGAVLSRGQLQLVAAARAVLADRPILILDEATSSIDSRTERQLQEGLARLMAGRTSLVIAHRLSTIRRADQILVLREGRIVERGTHEALLAAGGEYAALYQRQFGVVEAA